MFTPPGTPMRARGTATTALHTPPFSTPACSTPPGTLKRLVSPDHYTCRTPGTPRSASGEVDTAGALDEPGHSGAQLAPLAPTVPPALDGAGLVVFQSRSSGTHFLLLRSRHGARQWSFPKGHLNTREAALACALRETEEETGLGQDQLQLVSDFRRRIEIVLPKATKAVPSGRKHVLFFLARARRDSATRLSGEHSEMQWVCASQAARLLPPEQRELLEHAARAARIVR